MENILQIPEHPDQTLDKNSQDYSDFLKMDGFDPDLISGVIYSNGWSDWEDSRWKWIFRGIDGSFQMFELATSCAACHTGPYEFVLEELLSVDEVLAEIYEIERQIEQFF